MVEHKSSGGASSAPYDVFPVIWCGETGYILLGAKAIRAAFKVHDGPKE
jgi:hypothetical protein